MAVTDQRHPIAAVRPASRIAGAAGAAYASGGAVGGNRPILVPTPLTTDVALAVPAAPAVPVLAVPPAPPLACR